ncbi:vitamin B6 photo-protection and homoeostasis-domain-containing protein [Delphinella strobiligena]|nr:vitamin B6 photo-protection and homoeostasis-domain-containing protein [Delphinella strobiligena]
MSLQIAETDEIGNVIATYVQSTSAGSQEARIDVILSHNPKSLWRRFIDVFLPTGFPHSVSKDYLEYQIYDSLQAFSSSIAGLLASRAVLEGVITDASPTAALLLTILQESMGRIATILFAHRLGKSLEPECKMFRLLADIFNDIAMIFDCLSPAFPRPARVLILSCSSILRSLCGVAAGSAKASLSAHFALSNNLAELNAKDSSQETIISLLGMAAGGLVVTLVTSPTASMMTLGLLLSVHLSMNHAAVRAVVMRSLNRQRATIVFSHFVAHGVILSPDQVSIRERIFERDGVIRDAKDTILGYCKMGISLRELLTMTGRTSARGQSMHIPRDELSDLLSRFEDEEFIVYAPDRTNRTAYILLKKHSNARTQLKAFYYALLVVHEMAYREAGERKREKAEAAWASIEQSLLLAGWDLDTEMETQLGHRISLTSE